jgi:hypothetical protein
VFLSKCILVEQMRNLYFKLLLLAIPFSYLHVAKRKVENVMRRCRFFSPVATHRHISLIIKAKGFLSIFGDSTL